MRQKVKSLEELIKENKQAILKDREKMTEVEQKIDQRHSKSSSKDNQAS